MSGSEIKLSQPVNAPVGDVWAVLTDIEGTVDVLSGLTRVERLAGNGFEVGTRWRETRKLMGSSDTMEMWVAEVDPLTRTVIKSSARGVDYTTVFELVPASARTELAMTFSAVDGPSGAFGKLVATVTARIGAAITKKMMMQDLRDIAAAAEART
ncbi:SRPBCC family protein [Antrihabitans sp. YC3-6]|uniref:SRPBCC family protein n=1 Tax=Antrihabitans stalagmiti TaxID=2799499 RepID=A0A934NVI7_9NOCA|nr:SRPBCC family protein [Antrihabitans stalagmiti]MBJ8342057.1 SRPBCC family protein [Antrihabitans stalagmiti]